MPDITVPKVIFVAGITSAVVALSVAAPVAVAKTSRPTVSQAQSAVRQQVPRIEDGYLYYFGSAQCRRLTDKRFSCTATYHSPQAQLVLERDVASGQGDVLEDQARLTETVRVTATRYQYGWSVRGGL